MIKFFTLSDFLSGQIYYSMSSRLNSTVLFMIPFKRGLVFKFKHAKKNQEGVKRSISRKRLQTKKKKDV